LDRHQLRPDALRGAGEEDVRVDLVLQLQLIGRLLSERTMQKLRKDGFEDLRESDGYVFQHLVPGPIAVTELASRLGVTQQAASKSVADLEARGYVVRTSAADDARFRLVALSDRGMRVIKTTRTIRAALEKKLLAGVPDPARFTRTLGAIATGLGGSDALARRSLAPPR
jgi:DNA-binding MarR family transcriptional regulator